jgi:Fic family protein
MAGRVLREMVEEGILERRGKGARTVYLPVE